MDGAPAPTPPDIPARAIPVDRARSGLQALHDASAAMLARLDGLATERTEMTALGAGLDLLAMAFPPTAVLRDGFEILEGVLLLYQLGLVASAQPEQACMARAAGPSGMGGR